MPLKKKDKKKLTRFQWSVLEATLLIPFGETRSYSWVAKKIGRPKAVRAVGQALHKNSYPLIIPCHRVVQKDGRLGGYAKGVKIKQMLLKKEKTISNQFYQK